MGRYLMKLGFRGAPYHGWQRQPGAVTVQQTVEEALATVLRHPVPIVGAGRTDAGVNARLMPAHFDLATPPSPGLVRALNTLVGRDIAIYSIEEVAPDFHARFDAVERTYHYYAVTSKSPFAYPLSWQCAPTLDFDRMNEAADKLLHVSDFTSFAKLHTDTRTNICDVRRARWSECAPGSWVFEIAADRFLRNMVRAVVGTLVDVGRNKLSVADFVEIIEARNRCAAGTSMPPQALFLWDVRYPQ